VRPCRGAGGASGLTSVPADGCAGEVRGRESHAGAAAAEQGR